MALNPYFSAAVRSEQNLYEDIIIESMKIYGQDVYYLPRDIVNKDPIFADDVPSRFNSSYKVEMYIENTEGFDGEGDLFTKFGVQLRDQATFIVSRRRWTQTVKRYDNEITGQRPREGDLIYLPLSNTIFEIMFVEHEQPFYQLSNLPTYKMRCEKFEYNDEQLDTGIEQIDDIEQTGFNMVLTLQDSSDIGFIIGNEVYQTLSSGIIVNGEVVRYDDPNNNLYVAHVGSNDTGFHIFTTGNITSLDSAGNTLVRTVTSTSEQLNQPGAQNTEFDNIDFIDFSENNPFGDVEIV